LYGVPVSLSFFTMCADLSVSVTTPVAEMRKLEDTSDTDLMAKQPVPGGVMGPTMQGFEKLRIQQNANKP
jgi:hypothetical protein